MLKALITLFVAWLALVASIIVFLKGSRSEEEREKERRLEEEEMRKGEKE